MDVEVKILRMRDVMERTRCSKSKVYSMIKRGEFPSPVKVGGVALWPRAAVDAWCAAVADGVVPSGTEVVRVKPLEV